MDNSCSDLYYHLCRLCHLHHGTTDGVPPTPESHCQFRYYRCAEDPAGVNFTWYKNCSLPQHKMQVNWDVGSKTTSSNKQIAVTPRMLKHTVAITPRAPYETVILILSCFLLLLSLLQLALTPILFTGSSCNCSWDIYPLWVQTFQWAGSALNGGAAIMTTAVCVGNFLNNNALFRVRSYLGGL